MREKWFEWGQTTQPVSGLEKLKRPNVTVTEAVDFFREFGAYQDTKGENTEKKYTTFFFGRLLPWCRTRGIKFIKEFNNPVTAKQFFMSWRNLQPVRGKATVLESNVPLKTTTKRAELERYRSFLEFCRSNQWVKENYAKRPHLTMSVTDVTKKYAPTFDEFNDIVKTLENWKGVYLGHDVAKEQLVFCMCLAFTGQRISDVVMFNDETFVCDDGQWFAELTQIKTGRHVKVPVEPWLVEMIQELPFLGESERRVIIKPSRYRAEITYGRKFWFWRFQGALEQSTDYRTNAKNYSDKLTTILERTIKERKKPFEHHMTPHCFRHFFAMSHLTNGVDIRVVSEWLGHANEDITRNHYGHYNRDAHKASAKKYMSSMDKMRNKLKFSRLSKPTTKFHRVA